MIEGPFVLASGFSLADIATIPWVLRISALEHYRGVEIPRTQEYAKIWRWLQSCQERASVMLAAPRRGQEMNCFEYKING